MGYDPQKVIDIALAEVGYLEKKDKTSLEDKTANAGDKNYTKYARDLDAMGFYNGKKNGFAWCDVFVDWSFIKAYGLEAALKLTCQPLGAKNYGAGCKYSRQYYKSKKQLYDSPKPGDQIFFYPKDGIGGSEIAHTGLVYNVDDKYVYTVEGNTSGANGVVANGGGVCKKKYALTYNRIAGYGRPDYGMKKESEGSVTPAAFPAGTKIATISGSSVNIRVGDSTKYSSVGHAKKGEVYEYVATSPTGWVGIRLPDSIGWVSGKYTKLGTVGNNE